MGLRDIIHRELENPGCPRCGETLGLRSITEMGQPKWECTICKAHGYFDPEAENPFELHPRFKGVGVSPKLKSADTPAPQRTGLQPPEYPKDEDAIVNAMVQAFSYESGVSMRDVEDQARVFAKAFMIFCERSARHGDTWKDSGWRGALFDSRKKMDRLWQEFMVNDEPPPDLDSALDLLNFVAFFVRGRTHGVEGTWNWRD